MQNILHTPSLFASQVISHRNFEYILAHGALCGHAIWIDSSIRMDDL